MFRQIVENQRKRLVKLWRNQTINQQIQNLNPLLSDSEVRRFLFTAAVLLL